MATKNPQELRDPNSYITYDDVLALALASTKSTEFVADPDKWQRVLFDIREKYKDRIKELKGMYFDESRSDLAPQSEEFYQLISILSASNLISLPNPTFKRICMDTTQKERTKRLEQKLLERYQKYIEEIAATIEGRLAFKS